MGKFIKLKGTKIGFDGTGYYRDEKGKYWYGNPANGYLKETAGERNRRLRKKANEKSAREDREKMEETFRQAIAEDPGKGSAFEIVLGLLTGVAAGTFMAAATYIFAIAAIVFAVVLVWPQFISFMADLYMKGAVSVPLLFFTAVIIFLIGYFIRCLYIVKTKGGKRSTRFAILCIACIVIPYILLDLLSAQISLLSVAERLFYGLELALLPTIVIGCAEYRARGKKSPLREIAKTLCRGKTLRRALFILLGFTALVISALLIFFMLPYTANQLFTAGWIIACILAGISHIYMGIVGKS